MATGNLHFDPAPTEPRRTPDSRALSIIYEQQQASDPSRVAYLQMQRKAKKSIGLTFAHHSSCLSFQGTRYNAIDNDETAGSPHLVHPCLEDLSPTKGKRLPEIVRCFSCGEDIRHSLECTLRVPLSQSALSQAHACCKNAFCTTYHV